jgi:hypothetical protein
LAPAIRSRTINSAARGPRRGPSAFQETCHDQDPSQTDFGAFDADGHRIFFKIDYLDQDLSMHSPDPADPSVTQRVITIMLAEEY